MPDDPSTPKPAVCAVKTQLTGQTLLLPAESVADYQTIVLRMTQFHQPRNLREKYLVQSLVDTEWRLRRADQIETGILALCRAECLHSNPLDALAACPKHRRPFHSLKLQQKRLLSMRTETLSALQRAQRAGEARQARVIPWPTKKL